MTEQKQPKPEDAQQLRMSTKDLAVEDANDAAETLYRYIRNRDRPPIVSLANALADLQSLRLWCIDAQDAWDTLALEQPPLRAPQDLYQGQGAVTQFLEYQIRSPKDLAGAIAVFLQDWGHSLAYTPSDASPPHAQPHIEPEPLTDSELDVLRHLAEAGDLLLIQGRILDSVDCGLGTLKTSLKHLEQIGMVERPRGPRNGYRITPKGKDRLPPQQ